jgi:hypothetical protein
MSINSFPAQHHVGRVHDDENGRIQRDRNCAEPGFCDPGRRKRDEGHSEQMREVPPNQPMSRRWSVRELSVRRSAADVQVLVTEGRVQLTSSLANPSDHPMTLDAGTLARTANAEVLVQPASGADTEQLLSWRTGFVIFRDTPLAEAVAEFNRYRVRPLIIADPTLAAMRIGGKFRTDNVDAFLALLQRGFPVSVEEAPDTVILKRRT